MENYTVITENDESEWDDQTGVLYHFPNKYLNHLQPGTKVIYYKGKIKNVSYRNKRLHDAPHYFGIGTVGRVYPDSASTKKDWFATIDSFVLFSTPVLAKRESGYIEEIPTNKEKNYWRDAVRPITSDIANSIVELTSLQEVPEADTNDAEQGLVSSYAEGAATKRYVTTYERNPELRRQAIAIHGTSCFGCGFSFEKHYGEHGKGYIHVHHTKPVAESGERTVDPVEEMIPLCANCHSMVHRYKNKTLTLDELRLLQAPPSETHSDCIFCRIPEGREIVAENYYAFAIRDAFPVSEGHTLIIPKRHIADYFDLTHSESIAINELLKECRDNILKSDKTITGFNVGVNAGSSAGQTIMHCHTHLIPRRYGDVKQPRGGVRGVIPEKQKY